jgi:MYXO-CTERM domain-containing protein
MYMLLDYAVGGWPGTPSLTQWPAGHTDQMNVDWVRVWQTNPNSDAPTSWNANGGGAFGTAGNWTAGIPKYGNEVAVFGHVGTASTATIALSTWELFGGITFDGSASGTTAYTIGNTSNEIQLASTSASGVLVQATAASTANQTINATIDLNNNTTFSNNMTGGQLLNLNGVIGGPGSLTVSGPGAVVISAANTYSGGTVIGSAQEAALLQANSNNALGTGTVVIGTGGNATTALLQIGGAHTLPNNFDFRGRGTSSTNNASVGIESTSGNNVLSGTISANVGGSNYIIQSDSSTLTLSGAASGATAPGVALQASASGSRIFTLQGAGNGIVSGTIANGNGNVGIIKNGAGTWTLSHSNTYNGPTTVNAGTLALAATNAIPDTSSITLNGGTLSTGGLFEAFGGTTTLSIGSTAGSALDLGSSGASSVYLADSHTAAWNGTLTINNWTFRNDHLLVGNTGSGLTTAQLADIHFADFALGASISNANTSIVSAGEVTPLVGDINQDGHVDASDITALEQALSDPTDYDAAHPSLISSDLSFLLDVNGDGHANNADIQSLINYIIAGNGNNSSVPEPGTFTLLALGALALLRRKRPRHKLVPPQ